MTRPFLARELIRAKRDGDPLAASDIEAFIAGVTSGAVTDDQSAAMLMAIYFRGLGTDELLAWTDAMLHSGDVLDLSDIDAPKVDKHSTGGVGDKISLPLAPAVAAAGVVVPMLSGRGLGHTGGTLDKLESIPGFRTQLSTEEFRSNLRAVGACIMGQSQRVCPADRKLYALRDVTATIESIPLIASSIMSKKLAEGIDALVLDVKVGSGAFMKREDDARALARTMATLGRGKQKGVTCVVTTMDEPIGRAVGNALEVTESIEVLGGAGPDATRELVVTLGAEMLLLAGVVTTSEEGASRIARVLDDGQALQKFARMIEAQGGDPRVCDDPGLLPHVETTDVVTAATGGTISAIDAQEVGLAALVLGGGRARQDDVIDPAVGVTVHAHLGDVVQAGQPLVTLHHREGRGLGDARRRLVAAYRIDDNPAPRPPLVRDILRDTP